MNIRELNQEQIRQANNNSFSGSRGNNTESSYKIYCDKVVSWGLSERKTQKILDRIYSDFSRTLSLEAQHVSIAVAGGSNYNAKRLDKSDKILEHSATFSEWFNELEEQATRKPYNRTEWITKEIIWGVTGGYSVNKEWKELAARSWAEFEKVYNKLSEKTEFKKTSIPYKIKNGLLEIEPIIQNPIYSDGDLTAYEEQGNICIRFRLKPQIQLSFALKSHHFVWIAAHEIWRAAATDELTEWVKSIPERYEAYI